jgi:hypothetical protein
MAQVSSRFTPEQVLEAGQRAEGDGRIDYAIQFYRHLTDYHPGTAEADEAAMALQRLAGGGRTHEAPIQFSAALQRAQRPSDASLGVAPSLPPPLRGPQPSVSDGERRHLPAIVARGTATAAALPPPVRGYRVGRMIAVIFAILGWLLIVSGLAAIGLGMVVGLGLDTARVTGYSGIVTGPVLIGVGIAVLFWSQLASAIFATANATQDLAAIERAKAEPTKHP